MMDSDCSCVLVLHIAMPNLFNDLIVVVTWQTATGSFATDESAGQNHTEENFAWLVNEAASWDDADSPVFFKYLFIYIGIWSLCKNGQTTRKIIWVWVGSWWFAWLDSGLVVYKHTKFQTNPKIKAAISLLNKVSLYVSSIVLLTWAISMGTSTIKSGSCIAILIRMIRIVYFPAVWMGLQRPAFHLQRFCQQLKEHRRKKNSHIACNIHQISLQTRLCFQTTRLTCIFECFLGRSSGRINRTRLERSSTVPLQGQEPKTPEHTYTSAYLYNSLLWEP